MKSNEFIKKNPEMLKKAQECKSLDEFLNLAKENKVKFEDISLEKAFYILKENQILSNDFLDNVAGGKKKNKLVRVDNEFEANGFRKTGYNVYTQYGENFVDK